MEWEAKESTKGDRRYWNHRKYLDIQVDGVYDGYMYANKDKPERVRHSGSLVELPCSISPNGRCSTLTITVMWMIGRRFIM